MDSNVKKGLYIGFLITCIVTAIITTAISFLFGGGNENTYANLAAELPFSTIITALICGIIQLVMAMRAAKKGKTPDVYGKASAQIAFLIYPMNPVGYLIVSTIVIGAVCAYLSVGIMYCFAADAVMAWLPYTLLKALITGLTASFACLHGSVFFAGYYTQRAVKV